MIKFPSTNEYVCVCVCAFGECRIAEKIIQQVGLETDSNSNDFQQRNISTRLLHFIHFSRQKNRFFVTLSDFFPLQFDNVAINFATATSYQIFQTEQAKKPDFIFLSSHL